VPFPVVLRLFVPAYGLLLGVKSHVFYPKV
jgi:hypothetical protein